MRPPEIQRGSLVESAISCVFITARHRKCRRNQMATRPESPERNHLFNGPKTLRFLYYSPSTLSIPSGLERCTHRLASWLSKASLRSLSTSKHRAPMRNSRHHTVSRLFPHRRSGTQRPPEGGTHVS